MLVPRRLLKKDSTSRHLMTKNLTDWKGHVESTLCLEVINDLKWKGGSVETRKSIQFWMWLSVIIKGVTELKSRSNPYLETRLDLGSGSWTESTNTQRRRRKRFKWKNIGEKSTGKFVAKARPRQTSNLTLSPLTIPYDDHVVNSHDLHSIIQRGLIPGGKSIKKERHAVFFTAVVRRSAQRSRIRPDELQKCSVQEYLEISQKNTVYLAQLEGCSEEEIAVLSDTIQRNRPLQHCTCDVNRESGIHQVKRTIIQSVSISKVTAKSRTQAGFVSWTSISRNAVYKNTWKFSQKYSIFGAIGRLFRRRDCSSIRHNPTQSSATTRYLRYESRKWYTSSQENNYTKCINLQGYREKPYSSRICIMDVKILIFLKREHPPTIKAIKSEECGETRCVEFEETQSGNIDFRIQSLPNSTVCGFASPPQLFQCWEVANKESAFVTVNSWCTALPL